MLLCIWFANLFFFNQSRLFSSPVVLPLFVMGNGLVNYRETCSLEVPSHVADVPQIKLKRRTEGGDIYYRMYTFMNTISNVRRW